MNEKPGKDATVTVEFTVIATTASKVMLLPPIDSALRLSVATERGATPEGKVEPNVRFPVAAALAAGNVIEPEMPLLIPGRDTVVDEPVES